MIATTLVLLALATADPTKPSLMALDFKEVPLPEVVTTLSSRSGNLVLLRTSSNDPETNPLKITLQAAQPVPFWDALDQLCREAKLQRSLNDGGAFGSRVPSVSLQGMGGDPGPAQYSGPFRFGKFALHAQFRRSFAPPARAGMEPEEGYRAEFEVLPEPRVLAFRTGPLKDLEALDDAGRSLVDATVTDAEKVSAPVNGLALGGYQSIVRIKLATPRPDAKRLKVLKGLMPVEIAVPPKAPTLVIGLADAVGKSFKTGDLTITIEEFAPKAGGTSTLKLVARIEGARGPGGGSSKPVLWARCNMIAKSFEVADAEGRPLTASSSSTSGGDELRASYQFAAISPGRPAATPKSLRVYAPEWVAWEVPFEFRDVPLP